jgi:hypothetical protein
MKILLPVFLFIIFASGCASLQEVSSDVKRAGEAGIEGTIKTYPIDTNQSWDIAMSVFCWEKTDEIEEHRLQNYMITSTGMKMVAFGSVMGVWFEPVDSSNTKVKVVTKRRVENDIFTNLTESTFFERFEQGLKIVQAGRKLPVAAPAK